MGRERLPELEPLWIAMLRHHVSVAPPDLEGDIAPFRDEAASWARRREIYDSFFIACTAVLHVAEPEGGGPLAGYAMVRIGSGWAQLAMPEPVAELESLSVAPEHRGQGLGTRLLAAVHGDLRARGVEVMSLAVLAGNAAAERLYARHGMVPVLTHMAGRVPPLQ